MKIEIKNLSHSYDGQPVLENVNMCFTSEKPVCIMGPSGRGKTTLFNILLGLIPPDKGEIISDINENLSAVFQEDRLCSRLSAVMNVAIVQDTPDKNRIEKALMSTGLAEDEIHRPAESLSGGQKRRVAIVRAMLADSAAVLMDEPFKGLDEETKIQAVNFVKATLKNRLLIVITHDEKDARLLEAEVVSL